MQHFCKTTKLNNLIKTTLKVHIHDKKILPYFFEKVEKKSSCCTSVTHIVVQLISDQVTNHYVKTFLKFLNLRKKVSW